MNVQPIFEILKFRKKNCLSHVFHIDYLRVIGLIQKNPNIFKVNHFFHFSEYNTKTFLKQILFNHNE